MKARPVLLSLLAGLVLPHSLSAQAVHWTFDNPDSPDILSNSGSAGGVFDLVGYRSEGNRTRKANIQSSPGVGGQGSALDLTSTPSMGAPQGANAATIPSSDLANSGLTTSWKAMTITGWYKASEDPIAAATLIRHSTAANVGWSLKFQGPNQLGLSVATAYFPSDPTYTNGLENWQFFAVTWTADDGAKWYAGTENAPVESAGIQSRKVEMNGEECGFLLGRINSGGGAFRGFLDDIRIYDKELSAEEIEAIRKSVAP